MDATQARQKAMDMVGKCMYYTGRTKEFNAEERTIVATASSGKVDRDREIVRVNGWDLGEYQLHPILLTNHNANDVLRSTIGVALWLKKTKEGLIFKGKLATTAAGLEAATLVQDLGIAAFSVGFKILQAKEMTVSELEDDELDSAKAVGLKGNDWVVVITKAKLFEISMVSLPADQYAVLKGQYEPTAIVRAGFEGKLKSLSETYKDINFKEYMLDIEEKTQETEEEKALFEDVKKAEVFDELEEKELEQDDDIITKEDEKLVDELEKAIQKELERKRNENNVVIVYKRPKKQKMSKKEITEALSARDEKLLERLDQLIKRKIDRARGKLY